MSNKHISLRLIIMNFLQYAIWGAYLTSMGSFLGKAGLGPQIWLFFATQGFVSIFMPALVGIVADRWIPAQKTLSLCQLIAGVSMLGTGLYAMGNVNLTEGAYLVGPDFNFSIFYILYTISVAFYMPTLSLSNSVAYSGLEGAGLDPVKVFPPIRTLGTVGFICMMWFVDLMGFQQNYNQFFACGAVGLLFGAYALTLPPCPVSNDGGSSVAQALGLDAFKLFKQKRMAIFFIFSMLLGVSLQITNGFANTYITSFGSIAEYQGTFGVEHANMLISLSQVSETLCILLIPFVMSRFGIKRVMIIAMLAWVFRFGLFGFGNPGSGVWMFVLSMIVYGVAFDFFNVSGSLFVNQEVSGKLRSSAQGLFVLMTNGVGATVGTLGAQAVINNFVDMTSMAPQVEGWQTSWLIFAGYALAVALLFMVVFDSGKKRQPTEKLTR